MPARDHGMRIDLVCRETMQGQQNEVAETPQVCRELEYSVLTTKKTNTPRNKLPAAAKSVDTKTPRYKLPDGAKSPLSGSVVGGQGSGVDSYTPGAASGPSLLGHVLPEHLEESKAMRLDDGVVDTVRQVADIVLRHCESDEVDWQQEAHDIVEKVCGMVLQDVQRLHSTRFVKIVTPSLEAIVEAVVSEIGDGPDELDDMKQTLIDATREVLEIMGKRTHSQTFAPLPLCGSIRLLKIVNEVVTRVAGFCDLKQLCAKFSMPDVSAQEVTSKISEAVMMQIYQDNRALYHDNDRNAKTLEAVLRVVVVTVQTPLGILLNDINGVVLALTSAMLAASDGLDGDDANSSKHKSSPKDANLPKREGGPHDANLSKRKGGPHDAKLSKGGSKDVKLSKPQGGSNDAKPQGGSNDTKPQGGSNDAIVSKRKGGSQDAQMSKDRADSQDANCSKDKECHKNTKTRVYTKDSQNQRKRQRVLISEHSQQENVGVESGLLGVQCAEQHERCVQEEGGEEEDCEWMIIEAAFDDNVGGGDCIQNLAQVAHERVSDVVATGGICVKKAAQSVGEMTFQVKLERQSGGGDGTSEDSA